jgi:hypothetical protein
MQRHAAALQGSPPQTDLMLFMRCTGEHGRSPWATSPRGMAAAQAADPSASVCLSLVFRDQEHPTCLERCRISALVDTSNWREASVRLAMDGDLQ